jgi:hypothetical protein
MTSTARIGVGLLLIESWLFGVLAYACAGGGHGFWSGFLPFAILIPPVGLANEHFHGRPIRQVAAVLGIFLSASLTGFALRHTLTAWVVAMLARVG